MLVSSKCAQQVQFAVSLQYSIRLVCVPSLCMVASACARELKMRTAGSVCCFTAVFHSLSMCAFFVHGCFGVECCAYLSDFVRYSCIVKRLRPGIAGEVFVQEFFCCDVRGSIFLDCFGEEAAFFHFGIESVFCSRRVAW